MANRNMFLSALLGAVVAVGLVVFAGEGLRPQGSATAAAPVASMAATPAPTTTAAKPIPPSTSTAMNRSLATWLFGSSAIQRGGSALGGLDFNEQPVLSTVVLVGTLLAAMVIFGRIRREGGDPDRHQPTTPRDTPQPLKAPPRPEIERV